MNSDSDAEIDSETLTKAVLTHDNTRLSLGARAAGVHYRLFSVWTLVPVRLDQQLSDHSTVDEIASGAVDCRLTYTMANCPQRRLRKGDLLEVARELGVEVDGDQTKVEIKDMILQNDKKDMETTKAVMEGILKEKEREFEERRQTREYELEWLRLSNANDTVSVSSADLEGQGVNRRVNLKDLVPKFDAKNANINLFFEIFERQAKKEKVAEDRWVSQLIPLLPIEIAVIVAKEPLEKIDDCPHIKNLLLARFQHR
ncbi:uncharacterized protein TNCV_1181791 [Trichonephila clavipes]|nr:uncharacterized protein TNCV_1181791 [Trichonephila clavipes]